MIWIALAGIGGVLLGAVGAVALTLYGLSRLWHTK